MNRSRRMRLTVLSMLTVLAASGCGYRPPDHAVHHGTEPDPVTDPTDDTADTVAFPPPEPTPAAIASAYRFAAGDELTVRLLGHPEHDRYRVTVDADGHIHYLQATAVPTAGRTVAELRDDLASRLARWYRHPVVSVQPSAVVGHRYFVIGAIVDNGSYALDRPLRLLDALARARGLEVGLQDGSTVEIADLERAMLIRDGASLAIDFPALLHEGDWRYNVPIHPGDVLYFPSATSSEVFVFGEVTEPGSQPYTTGMTVSAVIARRGGLTPDAYPRQVAIVRGNPARPDVRIVNMEAVWTGELRDARVQPGDIVYIPEQPAQHLRDLALLALRTFTSVIAGRAGGDLTNALLEPSS